MTDYRAYTVGNDGHFDGVEALVCANDATAVAKASALLGGQDIELWSGARFVVRVNARDKPGAVSEADVAATPFRSSAGVLTNAVIKCFSAAQGSRQNALSQGKETASSPRGKR